MSSQNGGGDSANRPSRSTYAGQSSLPRLPIPTLEETLDRFPAAVSALLSTCDDSTSNNNNGGNGNDSKEMKECLEEIHKFLTTDGPKLQKLLVEYDEQGKEDGKVGSYVEEFWTDAYLAPDSSLVMNLNPFFVLEVCCCVMKMHLLFFGMFLLHILYCSHLVHLLFLISIISHRMVQIQRNQIVNLEGQLVFVSLLSNLHPPLEMRLSCQIHFVERYVYLCEIYSLFSDTFSCALRYVAHILCVFLFLSTGKPLCMDQFRVCMCAYSLFISYVTCSHHFSSIIIY